MVRDDGFTLITRKKSNVKWAPLAKKDVERLVNGPKASGSGPSNKLNKSDGPTVSLEGDRGPIRPSDKAAGPNMGAGCEGSNARPGPVNLGSVEQFPPLIPGPNVVAMKTGPTDQSKAGPVGSHESKSGPSGSSLVNVGETVDSGPSLDSPNIYGLKSDPVLEPVMIQKDPKGGTGYFDTSVGLSVRPSLNTKNAFGVLRDEMENFDTKTGLWDHEVEVVKKYSKSCSSPPDVVYEAWNESMKKFYKELTGNVITRVESNQDDEVEVESETDETARFMKLNS
ncbi:hypothetical protein Hanom_Chr08g00747151 [Helianthus anomalus]